MLDECMVNMWWKDRWIDECMVNRDRVSIEMLIYIPMISHHHHPHPHPHHHHHLLQHYDSCSLRIHATIYLQYVDKYSIKSGCLRVKLFRINYQTSYATFSNSPETISLLLKERNDDPLSADGSTVITLDRKIINQVLKSTQINMIFSYKNYINKRCL